MAEAVNNDESMVFVRLDYSAIQLLEQPQGKNALAGLFANVIASANESEEDVIEKPRVVFVVDEGQTITSHTAKQSLTAMLELMDGLFKSQEVVTSVLLSINANRSELDPALLAAGRTHLLVELSSLDGAQAKKVVEYIQRYEPNLKFDGKQFHNWFTGATDVSQPNSITLGEIWGCFSTKESVSKWGGAFSQYAKKDDLPTV
jgi:hypothetical protein